MRVREKLAVLLVHFAAAVLPKGGRIGDFEYGIKMAKLASSNPPRCVCLACVTQRGKCTYELDEIGFLLNDGEGEAIEQVFDLSEHGRPADGH